MNDSIEVAQSPNVTFAVILWILGLLWFLTYHAVRLTLIAAWFTVKGLLFITCAALAMGGVRNVEI